MKPTIAIHRNKHKLSDSSSNIFDEKVIFKFMNEKELEEVILDLIPHKSADSSFRVSQSPKSHSSSHP